MYIGFEVTRKYQCYVDSNTGCIVARENTHCVQPRIKELSINDEIHDFPHTDKDFIILKAQQIIRDKATVSGIKKL